MLHSSFTAQLNCQHGQIGVTHHNGVDNKFIIEDPQQSLGRDGWLCAQKTWSKKDFLPLLFKFDYARHTHNRIYYHISGAGDWKYDGSTLDQSANGWLGLYGTGTTGRLVDLIGQVKGATGPSERNIWKIECLQQWDGNFDSLHEIDFYLRDAKGHRVSNTPYTNTKNGVTVKSLHAGGLEGELLTFRLHNVKKE